jgi:A/G-specific adenine glycosylase
MLQQTQVDRVIGAFDQFLTAYPTPAHFAAATPAEVVAAWGGLGYLRRARNLHAAATVIATDGWPDDLEELPGVGPYTAAAIAAFADGQRVAAIDVNLRRVLTRWEGA